MVIKARKTRTIHFVLKTKCFKNQYKFTAEKETLSKSMRFSPPLNKMPDISPKYIIGRSLQNDDQSPKISIHFLFLLFWTYDNLVSAISLCNLFQTILNKVKINESYSYLN